MIKPIKVLSIDGGGIRGIIPAIILAEIEKRTNKRISDLFDLFAGSSTGGLITLALNKPGDDGKAFYKAETIVKLYEQEGKNIFNMELQENFLERINRKTITLLESLFSPRHKSNRIKGVLDKYFQKTLLRDSLNNIIITSFNIERASPVIFKYIKKHPKKNRFEYLPMKQIALATASAPTYFEPLKLEGIGVFADGSLVAPNPSMCAYAEVKNDYAKFRKIIMLSLGTGRCEKFLLNTKLRTGGILDWMPIIIDVVLNSSGTTIHNQLLRLLARKNYFRLNPILTDVSEDMDDASDKNVIKLKFLAENYIKYNEDKIDELCNKLI